MLPGVLGILWCFQNPKSCPQAMGRGKELTSTAVRVIMELRREGLTMTAIAERAKCSVSSVERVVNGKRQEKPKSRSGRPKKVTERQTRALVRSVTTRIENTRQALTAHDTTISLRTAQRTLTAHPDMKWKRMKHTTQMNARHRARRLQWVKERLEWGRAEWSTVVFSDEKRWTLDGPDGMSSYWHHKKHPERVAVRRHSGGGSVMIWGAFSGAGTSHLRFLEGRQDAQAYMQTLSSHLLPFLLVKHPAGATFQHDNAPCHSARATVAWLHEHRVTTIEWPAMSPDLNPIEHLWGIMTRDVYARGKQYSSKEALKTAILKAWSAIRQETLDALIESMPRRCSRVVAKQGSFIATY